MIQHAFMKPSLVKLTSKDANLLFQVGSLFELAIRRNYRFSYRFNVISDVTDKLYSFTPDKDI